MATFKNRDLDILQYIIEHIEVKQSEISETLGIDRGNLSRRCNEFREQGILKNETLLEFNNNYQSYLILEIKQNRGRGFTTDTFGTITSEQVEFVYTTEQELQAQIFKTLKFFDTSSYDAIGCAVHAKIVNQKIKHIEGTPLADFDICNFIKTINNKPVYIENFANLAALSHYIYEYPEKHSLFYLRTHRGIGAGLIYHNKIFHGFSGSAMEPAFLLMDDRKENKYSSLFFYNENNVKITGDILGDTNTKEYIDSLNYIINSIAAIIDPEIFILDSTLFEEHEHLLYMLKQKNIQLSKIEHKDCYKSICKIILQGETGITYTRIGK